MEHVLRIFDRLHFQIGRNVEPFRIEDRLCVGQEPLLEAIVGPSFGNNPADLSALLALVHELFTTFAQRWQENVHVLADVNRTQGGTQHQHLSCAPPATCSKSSSDNPFGLFGMTKWTSFSVFSTIRIFARSGTVTVIPSALKVPAGSAKNLRL
jgi:hypothetical protein